MTAPPVMTALVRISAALWDRDPAAHALVICSPRHELAPRLRALDIAGVPGVIGAIVPREQLAALCAEHDFGQSAEGLREPPPSPGHVWFVQCVTDPRRDMVVASELPYAEMREHVDALRAATAPGGRA